MPAKISCILVFIGFVISTCLASSSEEYHQELNGGWIELFEKNEDYHLDFCKNILSAKETPGLEYLSLHGTYSSEYNLKIGPNEYIEDIGVLKCTIGLGSTLQGIGRHGIDDETSYFIKGKNKNCVRLVRVIQDGVVECDQSLQEICDASGLYP